MLCPIDDRCQNQKIQEKDWTLYRYRTAELSRPIPRLLHMIWLGPQKPLEENFGDRCALWQQFALEKGYKYTMWSEEKIRSDIMMESREKAHFDRFMITQNWWAASDLAR